MNYFNWNGKDWVSCAGCSRQSIATIKPDTVFFLVQVSFPTYSYIETKNYYLVPNKVLLNIDEYVAGLLVGNGLGSIVDLNEAIKYQGYFV